MSVIASVDIGSVTRRTSELKFSRVALLVLAAPFLLVGLTLRLLWLMPAFLISSGVEGWQMADKLVKQWQAKARESAARGG